LRLVVLTPVLAHAGICGVMMFLEGSLIFFPMPYPQGDWEQRDVPVEDAWFEADDGTQLHGWFLDHPRPRAVVLFAHGNAGNLTHRLEHIARLSRDLRLSVLIFDYRGYGRSQGRPDEQGLLADARAARRWLGQRVGLAEPQIVLHGESLGGGVLVDLAARDGARGLVLESTFSSLPDVAAHHYPLLPVRWLMRNRLDSLAKIGQYRGPLVQCHGDADSIVPLEQAQRLFAAATGSEPKRFVQLPGHDHNDPLPDEWYEALEEFYGSLPRSNDPPGERPASAG
jgi:fermentation-respiration switch protein FrsA (DUF1100 family)